MRIIGITGSMAMGKSTLVRLLRMTEKYPIWDADEEVKKLYQLPSILKKIQALQQDLVIDQRINKSALTAFLLKDVENLEKLEAILYPDLAKSRHLFIKKNKCLGQEFVFLDIPLLYEKKLESLCDYVIVVTCPDWLQEKRLKRRKNTPKSVIEILKKQQLPSSQKRNKADFIVHTGLNRRYALEQIGSFLRYIKERESKNGA